MMGQDETLRNVESDSDQLWVKPICDNYIRTIYDLAPQEEMFNVETTYESLDQCIDDARNNSDELFSITNLIRGRNKPPKKKCKTCDLKPIVYVRFNTSLGKPKPVTLRALLDSGRSGSLVTQ
jgi:hypothetical protein